MTNEEFFEKVKGKKIRWVFADGKKSKPIIFKDWKINGGDEFVSTQGEDWSVINGFNKRDNHGYWEFYEDPNEDTSVEVGKIKIFTLCDHFWMVFVDSQKIPQCKHDTYESAKEEAERLAKKSGAEVALIECVSIKKCKAVKKVEWEEI